MSKFGLLYEKLIVQPSPNYPDYYMMVRKVIEEMADEFPMKGNNPFSVRGIDAWFVKWFGGE